MTKIPSIRFWRLMRHVAVPQGVYPLLRLDPENKDILIAIILAWAGTISAFALLIFLVLPFSLQCAYLYITVGVAKTLKKQEQGRGDLLALTPLGNMGLILAVAKAYCRRATFSLKTALKILFVVAGGLLLLFNINNSNFNHTLTQTLIISGYLAALFIDHSQCLVCATVIGILANSYGSRSTVSIVAAVGYLVFQGLLSLMLIFSLIWVDSLRNHAAPEVLFPLIAGVYFGIREIAIAIGWRLIYSRLNDDAPTLKPL